jgi:hypothetical protein
MITINPDPTLLSCLQGLVNQGEFRVSWLTLGPNDVDEMTRCVWLTVHEKRKCFVLCSDATGHHMKAVTCLLSLLDKLMVIR